MRKVVLKVYIFLLFLNSTQRFGSSASLNLQCSQRVGDSYPLSETDGDGDDQGQSLKFREQIQSLFIDEYFIPYLSDLMWLHVFSKHLPKGIR